MMGIHFFDTVNLHYGLKKNRRKLVTLSQSDEYARNKFIYKYEYEFKQQYNPVFRYILLYTIFSSFFTKVDYCAALSISPSVTPLRNGKNIAKIDKEEPILSPFKDVENGKISDATMPSIDPYASMLLKSLEKTTGDFSKEYLETEKKSNAIRNVLPFGTNFKYDTKEGAFEISENCPVSIGGVFQSVLDAETELRYKFRDNVYIDYKIQTYVSNETAKIIDAIHNKDIKSLRENHHLVFSRLIEPLRSVLAIKKIAKDQLHIMESFDKNWYESAKPSAKLKLVTKIDQLLETVPTYKSPSSLFTKVSATRAFLKSKYTNELINLETEIRAQKIIREYMQGVKVIRHYSNFTPMYLAPYYTDLVPALGSPWLNHLFDKYYMATAYASETELAEILPLIMTRFLSMVEQNAVTVTNDDFQKSIYAFSLAVGKTMRDIKANKYKLSKTEYYGFMGMCDEKCEEKIISELNGNLIRKGKIVKFLRKKLKLKKLSVSKGLKFIRWVTMYQKTELMMMETFAEKVIIQLILRTNNVDMEQIARYKMDSQRNFKLNFDVKSIKPHDLQHTNTPNKLQGHEFVEKSLMKMVKTVGNKLRRFSGNAGKKLYKNVKRRYHFGKDSIKKFPLVKWILSGISNLHKMRKTSGFNLCSTFTNVLKPSLGLDSNILSTNAFVKDLVEVKHDNEVLSDWYNHTMQTWIQISSAHSSLHGFDPQVDKNVSMSKSLGALFRWLNSSESSSFTFTNKDKTVLSSLSLQLAFFMDSSVKGYKKSSFGKFLTKFGNFGNIFRMGKTSTVADNWHGLNDALEPKAVVSRAKFVNGSRAVLALVKMFEDKFIVKPAIPARLVQLIVIFIGMWTKNQQEQLDLASAKIEPARKYFYVSLLSNNGIPNEATKMIIKHCKVKSRRKALHLGCINKVNGRNVKCRPVRIKLTKLSLLKVIEELQGTMDDPLDMLRIASDLSKRCQAHNTQKAVNLPLKKTFYNKIKRKLYGQEEYTGAALLASEFSQRLHCYNLQKKVAKQLVSKMRGVYDIEKIKEIFGKLLYEYQSMEIKMKSQNDFGAHKLMCQFMDANNPKIVKVFKERLLKYAVAHSGVVGKRNLTKDEIESIVSFDIKSQNEYAKEIHNYHSYILVGTRVFNSITYSGGYPPNHVFEAQKQVQSNGKVRSVFNGSGFVDELEELKITDPINNITIETMSGEASYRRFYHLTTGEKLDEYDYALKANNFVVTGSVLTTSRALAENGYESGMIIWCGYKHGWVADFALRDVIHDINAVPLFNGRNWVLSTETRVKDFIGSDGKKNTFGIGSDYLDKKLEDINVVYKFENGTSFDAKTQNTASYPTDIFGKFDPVNTVQGNQPPLFSTTSADLLPGALSNFVKGSEFKKDTNTLIVDLNAPDNVIKSNTGAINLIRFNMPPNVNFESKSLHKVN